MMRFVTVLLPNLPIAVARRDDPKLAARPLLLAAPSGTHVNVAAASDDLAALVGRPLRQALGRCPAAAVRRANPARDAQVVTTLRAALDRLSPRVAEQRDGTEALLTADLGEAHLPAALAQVGRLAGAIRATVRLEVALGLAANPLVARLAARVAGVGAAIVVPPGQEAAFLVPQPIALLPIEADVAERLGLFGLRTIGAVAQLPRDALAAQFGTAGAMLHDLAHGRNPPLFGARPDAARVVVRRRFAGAVVDGRVVAMALDQLAAELAARLDAGGWAVRALTLVVTLADDAPQAGRRMFQAPTSDVRQLRAALGAMVRTLSLTSGVDALSVAATELTPRVIQQAELFAPAASRHCDLDGALAQLAARFPGQLLRAALADADAACPERRVRLDTWDPR
jgi:nucleotidyltransferase/DNA polymerase involved in DNA repair